MAVKVEWYDIDGSVQATEFERYGEALDFVATFGVGSGAEVAGMVWRPEVFAGIQR